MLLLHDMNESPCSKMHDSSHSSPQKIILAASDKSQTPQINHRVLRFFGRPRPLLGFCSAAPLLDWSLSSLLGFPSSLPPDASVSSLALISVLFDLFHHQKWSKCINFTSVMLCLGWKNEGQYGSPFWESRIQKVYNFIQSMKSHLLDL